MPIGVGERGSLVLHPDVEILGIDVVEEGADHYPEDDDREHHHADQRAGVVAEGEPHVHPQRAVHPRFVQRVDAFRGGGHRGTGYS